MDAAQIVILVIAGIGILVFIKYKISGSLKPELRFTMRVLDRGYAVFAILACAGSLMAAGVKS